MPPAPSSQAASSSTPEPFQPAAALLAVAFPGLGHFYLGQVRRGILITAGVLGLYLTGLLIGGISCVDRENFIWFLGQSLNGPITFALDYVHQQHFKVLDPRTGRWRSANPDETRDPRTGQVVLIAKDAEGRIAKDASGRPYARTPDGRTIAPAYPPYVKSLSHTNELGTLFTTIAGFLNVIVIIDAAWNHRVVRRRTPVAATGVTRTLRAPG